MRAKVCVILPILLMVTSMALSQPSSYEYFITINGNLYLPVNTPDKGVYPILWYDNETDPKLLIGGFGFGFTALKSFKEKFSLKGQANLSRHTYWDEPTSFKDVNNNPLIPFQSASSDFALGLTAGVHYFIGERFSVGTGLGCQVLLFSLSRLPDKKNFPIDSEKSIAFNKYYKPFMPVIPLEMSYTFEKLLLNIRYEHGLLNRLKTDLAKYKNDKFGLLTFEFGYRLR